MPETRCIANKAARERYLLPYESIRRQTSRCRLQPSPAATEKKPTRYPAASEMAGPAGRAAESWSAVAVLSLRRFRPQAQHLGLQPPRAETTSVRYSPYGVAELIRRPPTP